MKKSRKRIFCAGVMAGLMFVMGCGTDSGRNVSTEAESSAYVETAGEEEKQQVMVWTYYETDQQKSGLSELIRRFNESQDQYEAEWEYHGSSAEFKKQLSIAIAEKNIPDIVIIDNPDMRKYVELGIFEDITEEVQENFDLEDFYPEVLCSVEYDGKYYGMPFCCNNVALFYNKDYCDAAGVTPPEDWESFGEAAAALTTEDHYGFAMSAIKEEQGAFQILPWILSAGEEMEELGGEKTEKAFAFLQQMEQEGSISKECINWSQVDVARKFVAGDCAMMENGPWVLPLIEEAGINYGIVRLPVDEKGAVVAGGENLAVTKGKNTKGALALIRYYYQEEVMLDINEQMYSIPPKKELAVKLQEKNEVYQVFVEQMDNCISRSSYTYWPQITEPLWDGLYGVLTEQSTAEEAAEGVREKMP